MKILITGVGGAIGSHLAERLLSEGHEVIGIDALTPYYSPEIKKINISDVEAKGGKVFIRDLSFDNLGELFDDVDFIFHLAAQPGISISTSFDDYIKNNIIATQKLLDKAREIKNLKGFIFASTSSVYGLKANSDEESETKPVSNYGVTKLAAEQLALSYYRNYGLPVASLRFFSVYGERERPEKLFHKLIKSILENREFPIYKGSEGHKRSYTYVSDIVDGCVLVLNNFEKAVGQIFNLGNDKSETTGFGIELIEKIIGKKAKFITLPPRNGDQLETIADISKMRKTFGYEPRVNLAEGLKKEVDWYTEKIYKKQDKNFGLITRVYAKNENDVVVALRLTRELIKQASKLEYFSRIDILVPTDKRYEHCDFGGTSDLLKQEKFGNNVFIHEVEGDFFCDLLNYGTQLHYTNNINYSVIISPEAFGYTTKENIKSMILAVQSGAKVAGIAIDELKNYIFDGRITNTCAMWDNTALVEVGGFDLRARSRFKNEQRLFSGVEEVIPLIRMVERYNKCIAPIPNISQSKLIWPDKDEDPEKFKKFEFKIKSKNIRQRHFAESVGSDIDILKEGIMSQYRKFY